MYIYVYICVCVYMCVYVCVYIYVYICVYIYVYMCVYICICMYVYIYGIYMINYLELKKEYQINSPHLSRFGRGEEHLSNLFGFPWGMQLWKVRLGYQVLTEGMWEEIIYTTQRPIHRNLPLCLPTPFISSAVWKTLIKIILEVMS